MVFVFDIDDTLCNTAKFSFNYIKDFFAKYNLPYRQVKKVSRFAEGYFDWDDKTANKWYKKYGDEMMLNFPVYSEVKPFFDKLLSLGHIIILSTARARDWHSAPKTITKNWLKKNKIKYSKIYIGRQDKEKICLDENADFFIDDDINILTRVQTHTNGRVKTFLTTTDYNKNLKVPAGVTRVENFADFVKRVYTQLKIH